MLHCRCQASADLSGPRRGWGGCSPLSCQHMGEGGADCALHLLLFFFAETMDHWWESPPDSRRRDADQETWGWEIMASVDLGGGGVLNKDVMPFTALQSVNNSRHRMGLVAWNGGDTDGARILVQTPRSVTAVSLIKFLRRSSGLK